MDTNLVVSALSADWSCGVRALISAGAPVPKRVSVSGFSVVPDEELSTLSWAAVHCGPGCLELIAARLGRGAHRWSVEASPSGRGALHAAAEAGKEKNVGVLLAAGFIAPLQDKVRGRCAVRAHKRLCV